MPIVDQQGRLFGRFNLLDAVLLVLIAGVVPLSLAAYALFRDQPPTITSVTPNRVHHSREIRVTIRGENFRPYMRASANSQQALDYIFKSTTEAEIPFVDLPPGEYDIVLYDHSQERFRVPNGLTVEPGPLPATQMIAVGAFGNLDTATAAKVVPGLSLDGLAEVVRVGAPVPDRTVVFSGVARVGVMVPNALRLPVVVRFTCAVRTQLGRPDCIVRGSPLAATALLMLRAPFGDVPFAIDQVLSTEPIQPTAIQVRFSGDPAILALMKTGDADRAGTANDLAAGAVVTQVGAVRSASETSGSLDATLRADLQAAPEGWLYDSSPLRAGAVFLMRTARYVMTGTVIAVPAPPRSPAAP